MSVLIVDDHAPFRRFLRSVLEGDGLSVVGDVGDGESAVATAAAVHPDAVLLDIHLGDGPDGFEVARRLADLPAPPVVILTSSRDGSAFQERISTAPVAAFVPKDELTSQTILDLSRHEHRTSVAIADDSVLFREGVARVLDDLGFAVAAQVGDGAELLRALETTPVDVAIIDIRMPPTFTTEGIDTARLIGERFPDLGVIVLSQHLEPGFAMRLLADQPARRGYLLKDRVGDLDSFRDAVSRVAAGGLAIDRAAVDLMVDDPEEPLPEMTDREVDVLRLMAAGLSNDGIAAELFLSTRTVEAHISRIFDKMEIERSTASNRRVIAVLAYLHQAR